MLRHIIRLMWNKKGSHLLIIVEILASFLVLFGVTSLIVYNLQNYREPIGFEYKNRWSLGFDSRGEADSTVGDIMQQIKSRVLSYPQVEAATMFSNNIPFTMNSSNGDVTNNKATTLAQQFRTDLDMPRTLGVSVLEGRWFDKSDELPDARTLVINTPLKKALFGDEPALGKKIAFGGVDDKRKSADYFTIVGIVGNFKPRGEYQENLPGLFQMNKGPDRNYTRSMLLKVKPGTDAGFEAKLTRDLGLLTKGWPIEVSYLENQRTNQHNIALVPVIIFLIVSGFLLINVALGLFGVLNVSIAKRRGEIGLRRALGATERRISRQFVGEMWVLATFALVLGLLLAGQFPLLNVFNLKSSVYLTAIGVSVAVIYLLVTLCALFPSRQAATVQPAVALHAE
ncbi:ABC transporter permease [Spirosoma sordidisoli]|uniref:FtsX-like permease family protein n=1 Tax=Spirosoma sordidisoli TaxID=2502893 RepID=A0A4Q2UVN2_9BACT|nr:FtsX-like permease family protein [Spirosoma sordidisoli]RYC71900.1 FtsX-like permease family protein [Spirosoma sordidisoli]